ncbi:hypothetical protein [Halogeometricum limi]|uniref:Dirigent-like protein n=1 Tax=Halogeometricum limi TaxID=555875 RepID=A0A1I6G2R4_9EURY|nr:hypothetical protein [Halogeometricum limi]SFR36468.1 hypothetical protein SAMN04488124_0774 [Halogeometricum limi]
MSTRVPDEGSEPRGDAVDHADGVSRRVALGLFGLGALGIAASSSAHAAPDERCFSVTDGRIEGRILPSGIETEGTLTGAGPFNGSTALSIAQLAPSAGLTGSPVPPTTLSYTGTFEITTKRGTLTLEDVGIFDADLTTDGEFTSRGRVVGGTGRWEDARGVLFFYGDAAADQTFTARVNGTVCVPK